MVAHHRNSTKTQTRSSHIRTRPAPHREASSSLSIVDASWSSDPNLIKISWDELARTTDNFSPHLIVGDGNFGLVYKAHLASDATVAVKKLSPEAFQGFCEFTVKMETLITRPQALNTSSSTSSSKWETSTSGSTSPISLSLSLPPLPWPTRVNIIRGVAHGLSYLHGFDKEEEQNVVALEEVIRLCGRVVELEGLHKGKVAAQRRCDLRDGSVGEHCHRNPRIVGGVGCDVRDRRGQGSVILKDGQKDKPVFVNSYNYDDLSQHVVVSIHTRFLKRLFNNRCCMQSLKLQHCHRVSFNNVSQ
ncbi:Leucine-rich repeat receptor protein kinase EMS1 [Glycine soja]